MRFDLMTVFPKHEIFTMGDWMDEFLFGKPQAAPMTHFDDVGDALELTLEAPGVKKEDLRLEIQDGTIQISGTRKGRKGNREFRRSFELPPTVNPEGVEASLNDGVLIVRLPKTRVASPRLIPLKN